MLVTNNKLYSNADVGLCKANLTKLSFDAVSHYFNFHITEWFVQQVVNGNQMSNTRAAIPNDSRLKKILYSPLISRSLLFVGVTSQLTREILQYYGIYNQMGNTRAAIPNDSRLKKILYSPLMSRSLLFVGVTSLLTREILQYYGIYNQMVNTRAA